MQDCYGGIIVIRVFLKNKEQIEFELGDKKKEIDLVTRFHHGLDGNSALNLRTNNETTNSRIKVSEIKNMQHLKNGKAGPDLNNPLHATHDSKFKTREEYEKWKRQKIRENKLNSIKDRTV
jgi:hypothetical protein